MSPITIGFIGIAGLFLLFAIRVPVAFAMMITGIIGSLFLIPPHAALRFLALDIFGQFSSYSLSVIPAFILMGYFASASGITRRLFDVAYVWVGSVRGGLSVATVVACALFSAVSGSSPATAAAIGSIAYPEMKRFKYDDSLATGCIAGAGTLGPLIPPSAGMIVYGLITEQSITKLFMAGIIPGIVLTLLFIIAVSITCRLNPNLGPPGPSSSWKEKMIVLPGLIEMAGLFVLSIGGLFAGLFTPTQAGGIGAAGALIIGILRRNLSWQAIWHAAKESLQISCMVICLIAGAVVFAHFLSLAKIPMFLTDWVAGLAVPRLVILGIVCLFFIIGGCFIDAMGMMVISLPIIYPVIFSLGYDPIWFGVIVTLLAETGMITPPVGVNVFVIKGIAPDVPLERIFVGILPFFIAVIVALVILIAFPALATFLPYLIFP